MRHVYSHLYLTRNIKTVLSAVSLNCRAKIVVGGNLCVGYFNPRATIASLTVTECYYLTVSKSRYVKI